MTTQVIRARILIVEDDITSIQLIRSALSPVAQILIATSGQEAIAMCSDFKPDLVFLDLGLPDYDGFDLISHLNSDRDKIPFFVLTADHTKEAHLKALRVGAQDFVSKPIDTQVLRERVSVVLSRLELGQGSYAKVDSHRRLNNLLGMMSEAVVVTNTDGHIEMVNQYCLDLFGYRNKNELIGKNVKILTPPNIAVHHDAYLRKYNETGQANLIGNPREVEAITKSGKKISVEINLSEFHDSEGKHFLGVLRDVTERKLLQNKLMRAAMYDQLTSSNNLAAYYLDFQKLNATERTSGYLLAIMTDIDDFHEMNAVLGHEVCDQILKRTASSIKAVLSDQPLRLYRVMGDRFLVCCFNLPKKERASELKKQIQRQLDSLRGSLQETHALHISMTSICLVSKMQNHTEEEIFRLLELSLRSSKRSENRGRLIRASEARFVHNMQLATLSQQLQFAVDFSALDVFLQPKVNLDGVILGFEALLRWKSTEFDDLTLQDYLQTATATGAINEIGLYVLEKVCAFLAKLGDKGKKIQISVNLSIRQFSDHALKQNLEKICREHQISTRQIILEITETEVAENIHLLKDRLYQLKEAGFEISIDDFGTGQSNLRYIHQLPVSELKIDKSFMDDVTSSRRKYPIIDTIFAMARALSMKVVAEGIETPMQVAYLRKLNCDQVQGYFFYKPMPLDECEALITMRNEMTS